MVLVVGGAGEAENLSSIIDHGRSAISTTERAQVRDGSSGITEGVSRTVGQPGSTDSSTAVINCSTCNGRAAEGSDISHCAPRVNEPMRVLTDNGRFTADHAQIINKEGRTVRPAQSTKIDQGTTGIKERYR